jgi:hypothetical protein
MNASGDAAESIVRMSLQGLEVATRISGSGAKNIAALLVAILKDKQQTKGKTRLTNMLKSGKELKVFTVKEEDLKKFTEEAKRYGVLFCALKSKGKSVDGMVDIMVRAEDASKINRIVERFKLSTTNKAEVESIYEKAKIDKALREAKEKGTEIRTIEDKLVDDILNKPIQKEENEMKTPPLMKSEKSPQSEHSYESKKEGVEVKKKPSVRQELKKTKEELQEKSKDNVKEKSKDKNKSKNNTKQKHKKGKER